MPTPVKISRAMTVMLLRDLDRHIANAQRMGIASPNAQLQYADALTVSDAIALNQWAMQIPALRNASANAADPNHGEVRMFQALVNHFLERPQTAAGEPVPWSEELSPALAGVALGTRDRIEAGELTPAEAASLVEYGRNHGGLMAAAMDPKAEGHQAIADELASLHARAAEAPPVDPAAASGQQRTIPMSEDQVAAAQARWDELMTAMHGRMSGPDRAILADELAELAERFPGRLRPTRLTPAEQEQARRAVSNLLPDDMFTPRAVQLHDRLLEDPASPNRRGTLAELQAELERGPSGGRNPAPAAPAPAGSRPGPTAAQLTEQLRSGNLVGADRRAAVDALAQQLEAASG